MEQLIEVKLTEKYTDTEVEQFYIAFEADYKRFEQEDQNSFEIIFSMIDFLKFKETMLRYKKTI